MLDDVRQEWKSLLETELGKMAKETVGDVQMPSLVVQTPPKPEMGDIAFPLFAFAKVFHMAPPILAGKLKERIEQQEGRPDGEMLVAGPYLNIRLDMANMADNLYTAITQLGGTYGNNDSLEGKRIMVEFSCPNTNKPLHLGHMRNDSIGSAVSAILKANGAQVKKVNLINNRGVHICKSMLAYQKFGGGETPQSTHMKGDHFVGKYYVRFATWEKEAFAAYQAAGGPLDEDAWKATPDSPDAQAQAMLEKWEKGDPEVLRLWNLMNGWTLQGLEESYRTMGISFDKYYYESDTYKLGKAEVLKGLEQGVFYREQDGSVWVDLAPIGLDKKVLLRKDGTSLYMTQDIGTAITRHKDWPFDSLIYVVASEQQYHFKVLFYVLGKLGYPWAKELHHLSYGMVNLPEGKMKSREGTVVDADDLVEQLSTLAGEEIAEKGREEEVGDVKGTSAAIALGALNYYLLQVSPERDMVFNPKESISFSGNTGPYLQYMGARISSILRKFDETRDEYTDIPFDGRLLSQAQEREMVGLLAKYPSIVAKAGSAYDPSLICSYLYDLSKLFSSWYHDNPVLRASSKDLVVARVALCSMVVTVFQNAFTLIGVPFLEKM
ncbi:MAG: arginine--tRNA ligase [Sphaerochaeta sp.]|jgi:arginyl-tRNA synthetase|nr:arginine--tRNA ligase [Sphaerochaeta sp.]